MNLEAIERWFFPDDSNPKAVRQYRRRLALVACGAFLGLYGFVMPAMFAGWPMIGQVAWSKDGNEPVETKIENAVKPILQRLDKMEAGLTTQAEVSNSLLLELTEKTLTDLNRRRCTAATQADRDYWQSEMNKLKPRYLKYSGGVAYEQRNCSDL